MQDYKGMEIFATACFNGNFGDLLMEPNDLYWWNFLPLLVLIFFLNFEDLLMEPNDLYWWDSTPDCWPPQRGWDGEGKGGGGGEVTGAEGGGGGEVAGAEGGGGGGGGEGRGGGGGGEEGAGGGRPTGCSPSHDCQRLELILLSKVQRLQIAFHAQASSTKWTPVQVTHGVLHVRWALLSHSISPTSGLHKSLNILQSWPDQGSCSLSAYVMIFQKSR